MGEGGGARRFRQRPLTVTAIQWEPAMGPVGGVRARPKKHKSNPDEFYLRDRFGKEGPVQAGDWVVTYPDGSCAVVPDGTFQALYEPDVATPEGPGALAGQPVATGAGSVSVTGEGVVGGADTTTTASGGIQGQNPAPAREGDPD